MYNFDNLKSKEEKIAVVGLGYVGLPLALLLSKYFSVIGFDINKEKQEELKKGFDRMGEASEKNLKETTLQFESSPEVLKNAKVLIVAVPTPIDKNNIPDLRILESACKMIGENMNKGTIVVFESTVYPGVTEEICAPILEKYSGLKLGEDFELGYSPERVNPGDKEHTIDNIVKVVSASSEGALDLLENLYGTITNIHRAASIKVAEAAKIIENTQRDLNIALMNELAIIFHKMNISIYEVLEAAGTKWNFLPFKPGLVGGHCIGVDPYYLTFKAQELGHNPKVILAGRGTNDGMHRFIAYRVIKDLAKMGKNLSELRAAILGVTFKENVKDIRNSKVIDLYKELKDFGLNAMLFDPHADAKEFEHEYGLTLAEENELKDLDVLIVAVAHEEYKNLDYQKIQSLFGEKKDVLFVDIKNIFDKEKINNLDINYWTL